MKLSARSRAKGASIVALSALLIGLGSAAYAETPEPTSPAETPSTTPSSEATTASPTSQPTATQTSSGATTPGYSTCDPALPNTQPNCAFLAVNKIWDVTINGEKVQVTNGEVVDGIDFTADLSLTVYHDNGPNAVPQVVDPAAWGTEYWAHHGKPVAITETFSDDRCTVESVTKDGYRVLGNEKLHDLQWLDKEAGILSFQGPDHYVVDLTNTVNCTVPVPTTSSATPSPSASTGVATPPATSSAPAPSSMSSAAVTPVTSKIAAPGVATTKTAQASGQLAYTGFNSTLFGVLGAMLVTAGGIVAIMAGRRRRQH